MKCVASEPNAREHAAHHVAAAPNLRLHPKTKTTKRRSNMRKKSRSRLVNTTSQPLVPPTCLEHSKRRFEDAIETICAKYTNAYDEDDDEWELYPCLGEASDCWDLVHDRGRTRAINPGQNDMLWRHYSFDKEQEESDTEEERKQHEPTDNQDFSAPANDCKRGLLSAEDNAGSVLQFAQGHVQEEKSAFLPVEEDDVDELALDMTPVPAISDTNLQAWKRLRTPCPQEIPRAPAAQGTARALTNIDIYHSRLDEGDANADREQASPIAAPPPRGHSGGRQSRVLSGSSADATTVYPAHTATKPPDSLESHRAWPRHDYLGDDAVLEPNFDAYCKRCSRISDPTSDVPVLHQDCQDAIDAAITMAPPERLLRAYRAVWHQHVVPTRRTSSTIDLYVNQRPKLQTWLLSALNLLLLDRRAPQHIAKCIQHGSPAQAIQNARHLNLYVMFGHAALSSWRFVRSLALALELYGDQLGWSGILERVLACRDARICLTKDKLAQARKKQKTGVGRGVSSTTEWAPADVDAMIKRERAFRDSPSATQQHFHANAQEQLDALGIEVAKQSLRHREEEHRLRLGWLQAQIDAVNKQSKLH